MSCSMCEKGERCCHSLLSKIDDNGRWRKLTFVIYSFHYTTTTTAAGLPCDRYDERIAMYFECCAGGVQRPLGSEQGNRGCCLRFRRRASVSEARKCASLKTIFIIPFHYIPTAVTVERETRQDTNSICDTSRLCCVK